MYVFYIVWDLVRARARNINLVLKIIGIAFFPKKLKDSILSHKERDLKYPPKKTTFVPILKDRGVSRKNFEIWYPAIAGNGKRLTLT